MNDNLKKYSFCDLLKQGKIRIPKIQRDYAQGRLNPKVVEIRKAFVHTLLLVVTGKQPAAKLDFIYGSDKDNAFEPLDGQQRLTTLFLLHWMMGVPLCVPGDKKHSIFTYETRNTSNEFCDELIQHDAAAFVKEALDNKAANESDKNNRDKKLELPSEIIKGRDWFKWEWKYDPTINSMLVMIDAIYLEMGTDWNMDQSICRKNLDNISFNLLNLGDFGLSNELFIKMNARGKQLSDFDKLKSTLEEELQIQQNEKDEQGKPLATTSEEDKWRTLMDGVWIDFFWHKYARQTITDTEHFPPEERKKARLKAAKDSEFQFKKLILRLIALQLFEKKPLSQQLTEAIYEINEWQIDNILLAYTDSLINIRSDEQHVVVPTSAVTLDFKRLIEDVNLLLFKDEKGIFQEISSLLPKSSHIECNNSSLFDNFLAPNVPNDVELTFYAMLLFLRSFSKNQFDWQFEKEKHLCWLKNLEDWVITNRNILLNNNNNQRIDKIKYFSDALQSLKQFVTDLAEYIKNNDLNLEEDRFVIKRFLSSSEKTYLQLDNKSLAEERQKATLVLDKKDGNEWEKYLGIAEQHPYLWGQVRCLLNWSNNVLETFKEYSDKLIQLLDCIKDDGLLYYTAILTFSPDCWKESNRLYLLNNDRENSFKRYLREHTKESQAFGASIKSLIDYWKGSCPDSPASELLNNLIDSKKDTTDIWIQCIAKCHTILDEAWQKRVYYQNGHIIIAQRKTRDSHCFDPILVYLRNLCQKMGLDERVYKLYDSKGEYEHAFQLRKNNHFYLVKWCEPDGSYSIQIDDLEEAPLSDKDMKEKMERVINEQMI